MQTHCHSNHSNKRVTICSLDFLSGYNEFALWITVLVYHGVSGALAVVLLLGVSSVSKVCFRRRLLIRISEKELRRLIYRRGKSLPLH